MDKARNILNSNICFRGNDQVKPSEDYFLIKCPYCGSDKLSIVFESNMPTMLYACMPHEACTSRFFPIRVALCHACSLGFNASPLPKAALKIIYENYRYIKPRKNIGASRYPKIIKMILDNISKDKYLVEIGSSDGFLIDELIDKGYSLVEGFEPSSEWRNMKNKSKIRNEFFTKDSVFEKPVDVFC